MADGSDFYASSLNEGVIASLHGVIQDASRHAGGYEDLIRHLELACAAFETERAKRHSLVFRETRGALSTRQLAVAKHELAEMAFSSHVSARVARALSMSTGHFSRLFKASTGLSVHQWVIDLRMDRAKTLLLENCDPIAEIALCCGYTEQCHFTRTFTREVGVSPGSWRRMFTALPCE
ncbi:helix-turn-helix transcriptional regulator [Rhodanobacter hydrolyticus]|uniref:Helix-turn-helix transcriptional regulator n=1 Tax=Rhodanobacter hydrolyticus TaxID=2250595 RepID=A0ABW8J2P8_9GAMM